MPLESLLKKLDKTPQTVEFDEVIAVIDSHYNYTPVEFTNGKAVNQAGTNEGSCKIFAFARLNDLTEVQTLSCFGKFYREDVLGNTDGDNHANIRNFIKYGWQGIHFQQNALTVKERLVDR